MNPYHIHAFTPCNTHVYTFYFIYPSFTLLFTREATLTSILNIIIQVKMSKSMLYSYVKKQHMALCFLCAQLLLHPLMDCAMLQYLQELWDFVNLFYYIPVAYRGKSCVRNSSYTRWWILSIHSDQDDMKIAVEIGFWDVASFTWVMGLCHSFYYLAYRGTPPTSLDWFCSYSYTVVNMTWRWP